MVEWDDASGDCDWSSIRDSLAEWDEEEQLAVISVGWVIRETARSITLAASRGKVPRGQDTHTFCRLHIPRAWVRKVTFLPPIKP